MDTTETMPVRVGTRGRVPEGAKELAAEKAGGLLRLAPEPVLSARVMLVAAADPAIMWPAIAKATAELTGRVVRAQAGAQRMLPAINQMEARLRVRLEWAARHRVAMRGSIPPAQPGEWRHQSILAHRLPYFPWEIGQRAVIRRASYAAGPETPAEAAAELDLLDYDFLLFTERSTGQDSVLYRTAAGYALAMAIPQLGRRPAVQPPVTVTRLTVPRLTIRQAIIRLEAMGQPFTFFISGRTERGSIMYRRYDDHYGLIIPADADRPAATRYGTKIPRAHDQAFWPAWRWPTPLVPSPLPQRR